MPDMGPTRRALAQSETQMEETRGTASRWRHRRLVKPIAPWAEVAQGGRLD